MHATHLTDDDVALLGGAGVTVCLCPTTERDLADGIGPARRLAEAGARLATGTDSHAVIDPFEEARAIELDERLATGVRGVHRAPDLLRAATAGGYAALGWPDGGRLEPGALADLVTLSLDTVRLAGTPPEQHGGRRRVRRGRRRRPPRHGRRRAGSSATARTSSSTWRRRSREALDRMSALVVDDIGLLVTNDEALGEGPLGLVRDAALVIEDGRVAAIERAGAAGDERIDAGGRCVIPGFVDSHTHLVFAGDRGDEFAARMAGAPYAAGGIRVTTDATRAASTEELLRSPTARREEAPPRRHHPRRDQVRLRARRRDRAPLLRGRGRAHRRRHLPRRPRRPGRAPTPTTTSRS